MWNAYIPYKYVYLAFAINDNFFLYIIDIALYISSFQKPSAAYTFQEPAKQISTRYL